MNIAKSKGLALGFFAALLVTCLIFNNAYAKRGPLRDPDAPTQRQAKVLGWGPVKTPNRGKVPEFLIRGVILSIQKDKTKDKKGKTRRDFYQVKMLPIEVLNNHQRAINFDHFQNGYHLSLRIPKSRLDSVQIGHMAEYNQYYTEKVEQSIGGAKMIAMTLHQEIQGYPAGSGRYLRQSGFYPIQYKNALKGARIFLGSLREDNQFKSHLDYLATQSKDSELKNVTKNFYMEVFDQEPTGKCKLLKAKDTTVCQ